MKRSRKGFTLVELLIVVAILATLTATMMVSMSGSTAKAKAATIASNVDACVLAVQKYYGDGLGEEYNKNVNAVILAAIPRFGSFADTNALIKYTLGDGGTGKETDPTLWTLTVDFNSDSEAATIKTALEKIKGYDKSYVAGSGTTDMDSGTAIITNNSFKVNLFTGAITAP